MIVFHLTSLHPFPPISLLQTMLRLWRSCYTLLDFVLTPERLLGCPLSSSSSLCILPWITEPTKGLLQHSSSLPCSRWVSARCQGLGKWRTWEVRRWDRYAAGSSGVCGVPSTFGGSLDRKDERRSHCTRCCLGFMENTGTGEGEYLICLYLVVWVVCRFV